LAYFLHIPLFTLESASSGVHIQRSIQAPDQFVYNEYGKQGRHLDWSKGSWQQGSVTLPQAFGLPRSITSQISTPQLQAQLAGQAADSGSSTSDTGSGAVPPLTGNSYTFSQLEQIWVNAGGNPAYQIIAAAIAMAESGGNPTATDNDSNGTTDRGLWQINSTHGAQSTYNVMQNARAAVAISDNGTNWQPWTTYTTGEYLQYMPSG
jgi:hypothetical protein